MYDITIDQGATEEILIEDDLSTKVTILVSLSATTEPVIEKTANFVDGEAVITLLNADTNIAVGDYVYQIRLFDENDEYFNLEKYECTVGDCTLSKFKVCPSVHESEEEC